MKKIYMTPQTETTKICVERHLLAGSDPQAGINNTEIEEGDFASRGGSWFDEGEDE